MPSTDLTTANTTIFDAANGNVESGRVTGFYVFNQSTSANTARIYIDNEAIDRAVPPGQMVHFVKTGKIGKVVAKSDGTASIDYGIMVQA